jgi:hypothetical protein
MLRGEASVMLDIKDLRPEGRTLDPFVERLLRIHEARKSSGKSHQNNASEFLMQDVAIMFKFESSVTEEPSVNYSGTADRYPPEAGSPIVELVSELSAK